MKHETSEIEKKNLQGQLKKMRQKLVHQIERKKLYGLDHKIRQVQRQLQLMERI